MFTQNWYSLLALKMTGAEVPMTYYDGNFYNTKNPKTDINLAQTTNIYHQTATLYALRTGLKQYGGVLMGDGSTPPTKDDYKLSGNVISGFTYTVSLTATGDSSGVTVNAVYTITNTSGNEFTIRELGLVAADQMNSSNQFLFDRTVLDTPITIPAGGFGQVEYTIRINYPTA